MSIFDVVVLMAALCGLIMVIGGILLVYRGAIKLAATPKTTALSIEWRKQFRLNTQAPGIAFFLVGLAFLVVALFVSKPPPVRPLDILGEILVDDAPVTVLVRSMPWTSITSSSGEISARFYPDVTLFIVEATAPGYRPLTRSLDVRQIRGGSSINLGKIQLVKQVNKIDAKQEKITDIPFKAPPLGSKPAFGVSQ